MDRKPLPPLAEMLEACSRARADALCNIRVNPELRTFRWKVDRSPQLLAIAADGERLNDSGWTDWKRRKREVVELYERYPEAVKIIVDSGINCYERPDDTEYVTEFWQAVIWDQESVDDLVLRHTSFRSLAEMFEAGGNYRPSLDMREPHMRKIADAYDQEAERRGDPRRAYRYGTD